MKKSKTTKIIITLLLTLLLVAGFTSLLLFPSYNKIVMAREDLDPYRIGKNIYLQVLSQIAPPVERFDSSVLAASSIEDSIDDSFILDKKLLEESHTHLEIASVGILGYISEGTTSDAMNRGFWHFPTSAYPGQKGNSVIIGHRFQYVPPAKNTFFNLDKVKIGDSINIIEDQGNYTYIVTDTKVVESNDISILKATDDYRLTLVTCTPLWTSEKRIVITAKLDKLYKKV